MKKIIEAIDRVNYNISFNSGKYLDALNELKAAFAALNEKVDAIVEALGSSNLPSGVTGEALVAVIKGNPEEPSTDEILTEMRKARAKDANETDPRFVWSAHRTAVNNGYATIQYIARHFGVKGWNLTNALRYARIEPAYKKGRANYYPVNPQALRAMYKALSDYKKFVLSDF